MTKDLIKTLIAEYQQYVTGVKLIPRQVEFKDGQNYVFVGLRHAGKSYLMYQRIAELLSQGHQQDKVLYFNFEDDRIDSLDITDLELIKTCYEEMYDHRPLFFLDEVQLVNGWEKFARRLADQKYQVYITGSNAKMLSSEIATTLGGRYMVQEVFPYSFSEYMKAHDIDLTQKNAEFKHRKQIVRLADEYFRKGGLPETALMPNSRQWLSSLFSKIFFGDLVARHGIRNDFALKVLIRKLAESVKQPLSYSRMASIVSSTGKKLSTDAAIDYIHYMEESWLLLPFENYVGKLQDKEMNRKYYFIDNGLLALFLLDPATSLLENIVAVNLRRKYGYECYFFNTPKVEVDFYIPEESTAIQVAYSIADQDTRKRETAALLALSDYQDVQHLQIITKDEEETFEEKGKVISVIPLWKWLVKMC
ncbi:MAG: ATP-binding protein [Bacteroidales bacterium]|nr:ATP-binding protein [Bacteroidales bacterium]